MAEVFPSSLQQLLNEQGFTQTLGDTTIKSDVDTGIKKIRQRYTKAIDNFSCSIDMTRDEYTTLVTFYRTTLGGGVKTFNYDHPITGLESEFRFLKPPAVAPKGGLWFRVAMQWEEVPQ